MDKAEIAARYPRSRMEKLGVKSHHRVNVERVDDPDFKKELEAATPDAGFSRPRKDADVIISGARSLADLSRLLVLKRYLKDDGMIWVVWPKGKKELREDDVRRAALDIGLVDVKVMSFSEALSALKLVVPVKDRKRARRGR